jgi:tetratricopeptide (TPR) repeat protein
MLFLGRSEEQKRFREILKQVRPGKITNWRQLLFRDIKDLWKTSPEEQPDTPFLIMFHGEGGMGKTRLLKRLYEIAQQESPYKNRFCTIYLDWEERRNNVLGLQVGYRYIEPEAVLEVLYATLKQKLAGRNFREYEQTRQRLREAEAKVEKVLQEPRKSQKLEDQVLKLGSKGIAWVIRKSAGADIAGKSLESTVETGLQVSAEGLYQLRQFVQNAMKSSEYEVYAQPQENLAAALGRDIAAIATKKPLVIFLDTYEIVDRPECDYTLRQVMQGSGGSVVWIVAGRSNLADSGLRGKAYFRGYRQDFSEERLYAKPMSEFSSEDIQTYFQQVAPERPIEASDIEKIAQFSLGIPLVVSEIAAIWWNGVLLEEILAYDTNSQQKTSYEQVVKKTSERFLVHCLSSSQREDDLRAIYAMAMMRRPDTDLLQSMLNVEDLEAALQSLRQRYGFVEIERGRLHDKLEAFLWEYLLAPIRRRDSKVQDLHQNAIAYLDLRLEKLTQGITDTAEQLQEDKIAETIADKVNHKFWLSEEEGWQYLIPRFVEAWQYDRAQARNFLEIAERFRSSFDKDSEQRLKILVRGMDPFADPQNMEALLMELERLTRRGWFAGKGEAERQTILQLKRGELLYRQEQYQQALSIYLEAERQVPYNAEQLRRNLAEAFCNLSERFLRSKDGKNIESYLKEGEQSIERAVALNPQISRRQHYQNYLGVILDHSGRHEEAIKTFQQAISLDPNFATAYNNLGIAHRHQGNYEQSIAAYQKAITIDPKYVRAHHNLGMAYRHQGDYEQAIAAYKKVISIDPNHPSIYNGLGIAYRYQGNYDQAIAAYQKAISLNPGLSTTYNSLGSVYLYKGKYEEAISAFKHAIDIDSEYSSPYANWGTACALQGEMDKARKLWRQSLERKRLPDYSANIPKENLHYLINYIALEEVDNIEIKMQSILQQMKSLKGLLQEAQVDLDLLKKCPYPPQGIDTALKLINEALSE